VTTRARSVRSVCAVLAAAGLTTALGACSSDPPAPAPSTSTTPSPTTTSASPTSSGGSSGGSSGTSTGSRTNAGNLCTTAGAKAVVEPAPGGNSAGHIGLQVTVTNAGSAACVVEGFPGVSLVTGTQGQQLGAPARRTAGTPVAVTLAPGTKASAPLQLAQAANFPDCGVTPATGFRIYLPDDTAAQFSPQTQQGCSNAAVVLLEIGPFAR
jgi:hypothetical protein